MGQRELGGRERERERGCPRGFESHPQALLDALSPTWQLKPPKSQLHAGIGLRRHVEPAGKVPSESCVALMVIEGHEARRQAAARVMEIELTATIMRVSHEQTDLARVHGSEGRVWEDLGEGMVRMKFCYNPNLIKVPAVALEDVSKLSIAVSLKPFSSAVSAITGVPPASSTMSG